MISEMKPFIVGFMCDKNVIADMALTFFNNKCMLLYDKKRFRKEVKMKKILITVLKCMLFFIGWSVVVGFIIPDNQNPAIWRFFAELIPLIAIFGFTAIFYFVENRKVKMRIVSNPIISSTIGLATGVIWLGCTMGLFYILGIMNLININNVDMLWLWILSAFINVIMQELLVRGYLFQVIKSKHNLIAATIVSTILFTALHGGAISAGIIPTLNVITMSLLMTVLLELTQSMIAPIIAHAFWNIIGAIILGSVSLASDYPHLINTEFVGNSIFSGGALKFEGSIIVLAINIILIGVCFYIYKKKSTIKFLKSIGD